VREILLTAASAAVAAFALAQQADRIDEPGMDATAPTLEVASNERPQTSHADARHAPPAPTPAQLPSAAASSSLATAPPAQLPGIKGLPVPTRLPSPSDARDRAALDSAVQHFEQ
jgi:hypothetical protein